MMQKSTQDCPYRFVSGMLGMQEAHSAARLFCDCVHASNAADYTKRQLEAWAPNDAAILAIRNFSKKVLAIRMVKG